MGPTALQRAVRRCPPSGTAKKPKTCVTVTVRDAAGAVATTTSAMARAPTGGSSDLAAGSVPLWKACVLGTDPAREDG